MLDWYKGKRVFITGHTGFKGTWLSRILLLSGAEVTGYALEPPTSPSLFAKTGTAHDIQDIRGDVRNGEALLKAMAEAKPDVVFHLAAQPLVRASYKDPVATYETNVLGTVNVLEAVRHCSSVKSFLNVTTDKVYKNKEWDWGYRENEELCGRDPYSSSKSCSELVTYSYRASFFCTEGDAPSISTARSGNVIGGGDFAEDRIIPDCVRALLDKKDVAIRNPYSTRPYQHVLECLRGYLMLAQKQCRGAVVPAGGDSNGEKAVAGSYNFGPDEESCVTTGELSTMFCESWGDGAKWKKAGEENAVHEANFLKLDSSLAKSVLGWFPQWGIKMAVQKTVEWYKEEAGGTNGRDITDRQIKQYFGGEK